MKHLKRWLALLLSAVLALTFLSACDTGGGISSNSLVRLLSGELENVTVTGDANFDRALKAAVQKGGSDPDAVLAVLKEELAISGGTLSFSISGLGGGSAGRQGLSVLFEPGTNATAAANNAATNWLGVLRGLAGSGAYSAHVSMVQVEGGYILAIAVTVEQPGNLGSDDDDGPEPDPVRNLTANTFDDFINYIREYSGTLTRTTITLADNYTPSILNQQALNNAGIQGNTLNCGEATVVIPASVTLNGGLFSWIESGVILSNLNLEVQGKLTGITQRYDVYAGGIAGWNYGTIKDCDVTITGSISADDSREAYAGGIVGKNYGTIQSCTVTGGSISVDDYSAAAYVGGIAGGNNYSIQGCTVTNCSIVVLGDKEGTFYYAGAIAGNNNYGTNACTASCTVNGQQVTIPASGDDDGT